MNYDELLNTMRKGQESKDAEYIQKLASAEAELEERGTSMSELEDGQFVEMLKELDIPADDFMRLVETHNAEGSEEAPEAQTAEAGEETPEATETAEAAPAEETQGEAIELSPELLERLESIPEGEEWENFVGELSEDQAQAILDHYGIGPEKAASLADAYDHGFAWQQGAISAQTDFEKQASAPVEEEVVTDGGIGAILDGILGPVE